MTDETKRQKDIGAHAQTRPEPVEIMPRAGAAGVDWWAESVKLYRQNRKLRKALKEQHDWHLAQGEQDFGDGIKLNMADEYGDSAMCERTVAALDVCPTASTEHPSSTAMTAPVAAALLAVMDDKLAMYADIRQHGGLTDLGEHGELVVQGLRAAMACVADRYAAPPSPDTVREALDPNIPASLRGFARWLRNWAANPKKYYDPMPMTADTLEAIAAKIEAALSSAPVAPVAGEMQYGCPYIDGGECLLEMHSFGPCLCANPVAPAAPGQ